MERRAGCHPAVKVLLDEMLSPLIAQELRSRGHDVVAVAGDRDHEGMSDPDVMALTRAERGAVVTNNLRDYRPLHHEAIIPGGPGHYGMIFMPGTYRRTKAAAPDSEREADRDDSLLLLFLCCHPAL